MATNRKFLWICVAVLLLINCLVQNALAHGGSHDDDGGSGSADDKPNLRAKGLILVKIWCLIIVFVGTFAGGISPYFYRWNESFLILGTQFAGGVFLGTALMHFLSDSNETFGDLTDKEYPFAFMLSTAGYLITMLADCIIMQVYQKQVPVGDTDVEKGQNVSKEVAANNQTLTQRAKVLWLDCEGFNVEQRVPIFQVSLEMELFKPARILKTCVILWFCLWECALGVHEASTTAATVHNGNSMWGKGEASKGTEGLHMQVKASLISTTSVGDSVLLILALCFHSVFEGIAIGVAESKGDAWKALWTVCLHKIFAAIAMGIALLRMIPNRPFFSCAAYAFAFAISSPIGVGIGIVIDATTEGPVADWIYAISMGIACGVFVYVAINHLLAKGYIPHSPNPLNKPFYKFMAVLLGAAVIAVVMVWDT
eukprot:Gb_40081 [translate_table: standard]